MDCLKKTDSKYENYVRYLIMSHTTHKFYCPQCEYGTNRKNAYDMHVLTKKHYMNVHQIPVNYCTTCNKQYYDKSTYLRHLQSTHEVDVSELKYKDYY